MEAARSATQSGLANQPSSGEGGEMNYPITRFLLGMLVITCIPFVGHAQMTDDHGLQLASVGLGLPHPPGEDRSRSPEWKVYRFEGEGVSYYQVNDLAGRVQVIIGHIDGVFWVLPAGDRAVTVSLPGRRAAISEGLERSVVYAGTELSLVVHGHGPEAVWSVEGWVVP